MSRAMNAIPDPKLGPRKVEVGTMYNTERYRPTYDQKLGLPLWVTLKIAGEYASKNSSNSKPGEPFGLDPQTMEYIVTGYHLGDDGIIE